MSINRVAVNDAVGAMLGALGRQLDDSTLNSLTHHVADVLDKAEQEEQVNRSIANLAAFHDILSAVGDGDESTDR